LQRDLDFAPLSSFVAASLSVFFLNWLIRKQLSQLACALLTLGLWLAFDCFAAAEKMASTRGSLKTLSDWFTSIGKGDQQ
jgi:hypothetical protein